MVLPASADFCNRLQRRREPIWRRKAARARGAVAPKVIGAARRLQARLMERRVSFGPRYLIFLFEFLMWRD